MALSGSEVGISVRNNKDDGHTLDCKHILVLALDLDPFRTWLCEQGHIMLVQEQLVDMV